MVRQPIVRTPSFAACLLALAGAFLVAGSPRPAAAATGGPDIFGYTWQDGAEPGVVFAWEDITGTGTPLTNATGSIDDGNTGFLPLSFPMPYYGGVYTQVAACTNGWVSLVDDISNSRFDDVLPEVGDPIGIIAAFWDDIDPDPVDRAQWLFQDFGDRAVISWVDAPHFNDADTDNTFQIILYADGRIRVQYLSVDPPLNEATLGIESPDELHGLTVFSNVDVPSATNYVVEFVPPDPLVNNLDCAAPTMLSCGDRVQGDLVRGVANQAEYVCAADDFTGREDIYVFDAATPTSFRLFLDTISGNPEMLIVSACDPNLCFQAPTDFAEFTDFTGTLYVIVESRAGEEGAYQLRVDCIPLTPDLDCMGATPVLCGDWVSGDLTLGTSNQHAYECSLDDFSGREDVYVFDVRASATFRVILDTISGNPDVIILDGCDPNVCLSPPTDSVTLTDTGTFYVVVDSRPGEEGEYRLRVECEPLQVNLDCGNAVPFDCDQMVGGDLTTSASNQDSYWCTEQDFSGAEDVYLLDFAAPVLFDVQLMPLSGNPQMLLLDGCDPSNCISGPSTSINAGDLQGQYILVVDSAPGEEGQYQLTSSCFVDSLAFCGTLLELDPWDDGTGSWLVNGWLFHPFDTNNHALRIDGGPLVYTHDNSAGCMQFPTTGFGADVAMGEAFVEWSAPEGRLRLDFSETSGVGCCGLLVEITVTNTDTVPHSYDYRAYLDTAFAEEVVGGDCGGGAGDVVDGGGIEIDGVAFTEEQELLPLGADGCTGQVRMFSGDVTDQLWASYEMLPPNLPVDMEWIQWNNGGDPCGQWQDFVDPGTAIDGCFGDSSLLFIWELPRGGAMLDPGESASAAFRIGRECEWDCFVVCEDPTPFTGQGLDVGPCHDGIDLTWNASTFPGAGNGIYHVYRSTSGFDQALTQPPLTPPGGITATRYEDRATAPNGTYWYVVIAESLDFPNCGDGREVRGSTARLDIGPISDVAATTPPINLVGNTLRATAHTDNTVDFNWLAAPAPSPGESYSVFRANNTPDRGFLLYANTDMREWTDPDAPPTWDPPHVWFYQVFLTDTCGNISED